MKTITSSIAILLSLLLSSSFSVATAQTASETSSIWADDGKADTQPFYSPEESCERIIGTIEWEYVLYKGFNTEGVFGGLGAMNYFEIRQDSAFYKGVNGNYLDRGICHCQDGKLTVHWTEKLGRKITYQLHFEDSITVELRYFDYKKNMEYLLSGDTTLLTGEMDNPTKVRGKILEFDPFKKLEEGAYDENGKKTGTWKIYYANGALEEEGVYVDGEKNGLWKRYFKTGGLRSEGIYENGREEKEWKYYSQDGQIEALGGYEAGEKNGEWQLFSSTGQLSGIKTYAKGYLEGPYKAYNPEGQLRIDGFFKKSQQDGMWHTYYPSGKLKEKGAFDMEQKTGSWSFYYENGQLEKEGPMEGGRMEYIHQGAWKFYYENGQLQKKGSFIDGQQTGTWYFYQEDGLPVAEGNFTEGVMSGHWKMYHQDGVLKREGNYLDGELTGEWLLFHTNGELYQKSLWKQNRLLEIIECKDGQGNDLYIGTLKNGNGTVIAYDMDGNALGEFEYIDGESQ